MHNSRLVAATICGTYGTIGSTTPASMLMAEALPMFIETRTIKGVRWPWGTHFVDSTSLRRFEPTAIRTSLRRFEGVAFKIHTNPRRFEGAFAIQTSLLQFTEPSVIRAYYDSNERTAIHRAFGDSSLLRFKRAYCDSPSLRQFEATAIQTSLLRFTEPLAIWAYCYSNYVYLSYHTLQQ